MHGRVHHTMGEQHVEPWAPRAGDWPVFLREPEDGDFDPVIVP